jgi:hypothetical protein
VGGSPIEERNFLVLCHAFWDFVLVELEGSGERLEREGLYEGRGLEDGICVAIEENAGLIRGLGYFERGFQRLESKT